ncbi:glycosyl transferase [Thermococcus profundus]|uniref:Glycosyl transferase n=1 Tax=Thermococcus profundus TaxID=49899 RepID=A0A2Z2M9N2_THEPR|nr:glycosyltransferase family A protein [Thermococcus profundus]ASJ02089.1 glycosyl transferase [Thermococcus profundus]
MRSLKTSSYILVTPAKNEEDNLPLLARSVINQTIRPRLWVIVNDNSTDGTDRIISSLESEYPWIVGYKIADGFLEYDATMRYSEVVKKGFDIARHLAYNKSIPYGYIGLVDADFILERRFFEKIINEFHKDPSLGIASGGVYLKTPNGKKIFWERTNPKHPRGSPRLFRRECFDDIGGYRRFYTPDVVSNYLARLNGWEVKQVINAIAVQLRPTQSRGGVFRAYIRQGRANYHLGVSPMSLLARVIFMLLFDNRLKAGGLLVGYFSSLLRREDYLIQGKLREFAKKDMGVSNNVKKVLSMVSTGLSRDSLNR